MTITYTPKFNFHNAGPLMLRINSEPKDSFDGPVYPVSTAQARRIRKHFCGTADCRCNSGALIQIDPDGDDTQFGIPTEFVTIN